MRLIDADKLKTTAVLGVQLQHADSQYYYFYEEETIDNAPTVKAILIEWINKWLRKYGEPILDDGICKMIEDWEKENDFATNNRMGNRSNGDNDSNISSTTNSGDYKDSITR